MSIWKLNCLLCGDVVSTGMFNRNYYKMHLEAVHNVQQHSESLLQWALGQQKMEDDNGSSGVTVASKVNMDGNRIQASVDKRSPNSSSPLSPLLKIKGITVQRVQGHESGVSSSVRPSLNPQHQSEIRAKALLGCQLRQQEIAVNRWANGCEFGCRICRQNGKYFTSFTKQELLKHLHSQHEVSQSEYKEEFKNLISRASHISCKECGTRVKRIPTSLNSHFKKHGLNIQSYWLKHIQSHAISPPNGGIPFGRGAIPVPGRGCWRPRGQRGVIVKHVSNNGRGKFTMLRHSSSLNNNARVITPYKSFHERGRRGRGRGTPVIHPVVVSNMVDIKKEAGGLGEVMDLELDPMAMLHVVTGDGDDGKKVNVDSKSNVDVSDVATYPIKVTQDHDEDGDESSAEAHVFSNQHVGVRDVPKVEVPTPGPDEVAGGASVSYMVGIKKEAVGLGEDMVLELNLGDCVDIKEVNANSKSSVNASDVATNPIKVTQDHDGDGDESSAEAHVFSNQHVEVRDVPIVDVQTPGHDEVAADSSTEACVMKGIISKPEKGELE